MLLSRVGNKKNRVPNNKKRNAMIYANIALGKCQNVAYVGQSLPEIPIVSLSLVACYQLHRLCTAYRDCFSKSISRLIFSQPSIETRALVPRSKYIMQTNFSKKNHEKKTSAICHFPNVYNVPDLAHHTPTALARKFTELSYFDVSTQNVQTKG